MPEVLDFFNSFDAFVAEYYLFLVIIGVSLSLYFYSNNVFWKKLSEHFLAQEHDYESTAEIYESLSGIVGAFDYRKSDHKHILKIGTNEKGFFLGMGNFITRIGHPTLFIPWSEVDSINLWNPQDILEGAFRLTYKFFDGEFVKIKLKKLPDFDLIIPLVVFQNKEFLPKHLKIPKEK